MNSFCLFGGLATIDNLNPINGFNKTKSNSDKLQTHGNFCRIKDYCRCNL